MSTDARRHLGALYRRRPRRSRDDGHARRRRRSGTAAHSRGVPASPCVGVPARTVPVPAPSCSDGTVGCASVPECRFRPGRASRSAESRPSWSQRAQKEGIAVGAKTARSDELGVARLRATARRLLKTRRRELSRMGSAARTRPGSPRQHLRWGLPGRVGCRVRRLRFVAGRQLVPRQDRPWRERPRDHLPRGRRAVSAYVPIERLDLQVGLRLLSRGGFAGQLTGARAGGLVDERPRSLCP